MNGGLLKKAVQSVNRALGNVLPWSSFGPDYKVENGIRTWRNFRWGDGESPAEISAINYHLYRALEEAAPDEQCNLAVELGCGYGRITPWLTTFSNRTIGVDYNREMIAYGDNYYPEVEFLRGVGQSLPLESGSSDLVVTRAVLQHIPPSDILVVGNELNRILSDEGRFILIERYAGRVEGHVWGRDERDYERILDSPELVKMYDASSPVQESNKMVMVFDKK